MVLVESGVTQDGSPCRYYLDNDLKKTLDLAKYRVLKKNWDYVCIVCGLPGSGKSNFARQLARYCCPWFDENYIAWKDEKTEGSDVKGFIDITTECPENSAVVLDESFATLNSRVSMSPVFLRIINHIQLIRQKHLFIFLCLPNFFDLSKGIAIFRSSHLFITYADDKGQRGRFLGFDRNGKRKLFIKGNKYVDYDAQRSNFKGRFTQDFRIVPPDVYENLKKKHYIEQGRDLETGKKAEEEKYNKRNLGKSIEAMNNGSWGLYYKFKLTFDEVGEIFGVSGDTIRLKVEKLKEDGWEALETDIELLEKCLKRAKNSQKRANSE